MDLCGTQRYRLSRWATGLTARFPHLGAIQPKGNILRHTNPSSHVIQAGKLCKAGQASGRQVLGRSIDLGATLKAFGRVDPAEPQYAAGGPEDLAGPSMTHAKRVTLGITNGRNRFLRVTASPEHIAPVFNLKKHPFPSQRQTSHHSNPSSKHNRTKLNATKSNSNQTCKCLDEGRTRSSRR